MLDLLIFDDVARRDIRLTELKAAPHKGLEPLTVGLKVQRSTD